MNLKTQMPDFTKLAGTKLWKRILDATERSGPEGVKRIKKQMEPFYFQGTPVFSEPSRVTKLRLAFQESKGHDPKVRAFASSKLMAELRKPVIAGNSSFRGIQDAELKHGIATSGRTVFHSRRFDVPTLHTGKAGTIFHMNPKEMMVNTTQQPHITQDFFAKAEQLGAKKITSSDEFARVVRTPEFNQWSTKTKTQALTHHRGTLGAQPDYQIQSRISNVKDALTGRYNKVEAGYAHSARTFDVKQTDKILGKMRERASVRQRLEKILK